MRIVALYGNYLLNAWSKNEMTEEERDKMEEDFNAFHDYQIKMESKQTNVTHNGQTNSYKNDVEDPH
jgi:hypothetical protein